MAVAEPLVECAEPQPGSYGPYSFVGRASNRSASARSRGGQPGKRGAQVAQDGRRRVRIGVP